MIIEEINKGNKISYSIIITDKSITFNDNLTINLEERQSDAEKVIDVSLNKKNELVEGVSNWYVANVIIPAAKYQMADSGKVDESGQPILAPIKELLALAEVKLILWGLPGEYETGGIK